MSTKWSFLVLALSVGIFILRQYMKGCWCHSDDRIDGQVVIITGANTGIGRETALDLVRRGGDVVLACRSKERCRKAEQHIREETASEKTKGTTTVMMLDLASLKSINSFVVEFKSKFSKLDILINNAGVFLLPYSTTEDGFETTFGVNHLGHFYLTQLLLDTLKTSSPSRIINISSMASQSGIINFDDLMSTKDFQKMDVYAQTKLANNLFTRELAKRLQGTGVTSYAVHPGAVRTEVGRHLEFANLPVIREALWLLTWPLIKTPIEGAQTTICCAVDKELGKRTGKYYSDCQEKEQSNPEATDDNISKRLWDVSMELVGLKI